MIRVLLVENEVSSIDAFTEEVTLASLSVELVVARSRASAITAVQTADFDVVVCDLFIPSEDDALDESDDFGIAALREARANQPNAPALILSGFGTWDNIGTLVNRPEIDAFGAGLVPMVQHTPKKDYSACISILRSIDEQIGALDSVPIETETPLSNGDLRAIQGFVRSRGGASGAVEMIDAGLSGAITLRLECLDTSGRLAGTVFVKLDSATKIDDEESRYGRHVNGVLPPGSFAQVVQRRTAARGRAALMSGMIAGSLRSLHNVLASDEALACSIVRHLRSIEANAWLVGASTVHVMVGDLRRARGAGDDLVAERLSGLPWATWEEQVVSDQEVVQHGDLHGENVLVDQSDRAFLVDFASTGHAGACVDPVVLELGLLFHEKGRAVVGSWPSTPAIEQWADLDEYLVDCPVPDFVRTTREWALDVAQSRQTVLATAYAHGARQLRFPDVETSRVRALIAGVTAAWRAETA